MGVGQLWNGLNNMRRTAEFGLLWLLVAALTLPGCGAPDNSRVTPVPPETGRDPVPDAAAEISLPPPRPDSTVSLEQALLNRRSVRTFSGGALTLQEASQLLWAGQGITDPAGFRTAPSAGGIYPLELYLAAARIEGLSAGVYHYAPSGHKLIRVREADAVSDLASAAFGQGWISGASGVIVVAGVYARTRAKYGERAVRYVQLEAGHAAQNICLQAVALGLGSVTVGAFDDDRTVTLLNLPADSAPLYLLPVGRLPAGVK